MFWMRAYPLRGQVGRGWALEIENFSGPVKWHRADRRVPFGAQKTRDKVRGREGQIGKGECEGIIFILSIKLKQCHLQLHC
jgi:hypothetical protein